VIRTGADTVIPDHDITLVSYYDPTVIPTITTGLVKINGDEVFAMICSAVVLARM